MGSKKKTEGKPQVDRSAAAKKAAATRKAKAEAAEKESQEKETEPQDDPGTTDSHPDSEQDSQPTENVSQDPYPAGSLRKQTARRAASRETDQEREDKRQAELAKEREEHNRRTGDKSTEVGPPRKGWNH